MALRDIHHLAPELEHPPEFRCEVEPHRDVVAVVVEGELDIATIPTVEHELDELRTAGFDRIVLDLSGVTFMDSTGVHLLLRIADAARRERYEFRVEASAPVQRVLDLTGVELP